MDIIKLNQNNIDEEHICCAISDKKCKEGYIKKKQWIKERIDSGYVFKKYDVRHKVFIEYCSSEISWLPVNAPNYMVINCFWVAGSYGGKGYGKNLLNECIKDSKDKDGIILLSSDKKRPYLSDKKFFLSQGFEICDTAPPYFELLVYKNNPNSITPTFNERTKNNICENKDGFTVYYSNQCPYTEYYTNVVLKELAQKEGMPIEIIKINTREEAMNIPTACSIYSLFYKGEFITNDIINENKFYKLIEKIR
ncbi:GNAT family N-acetyltransferase [Clostridium sp. MSJ-11]|uniref:GNAT family N-acetyltransferase n=1 Tax=Clostridium mobile TaxID=2841512 RepID=A0ABS6EH08_9CLOT|nr:GNAT family N-acetyltransferase [Clostridium mobile]MBU5483699.1 GNAT family N-acetyltransferase [Clostridium mobile]